jgi:hypothetical protein
MDWGALVTATLRLYQQAARETWQKVQRGWWVGLLPLLYALLFFFSAILAAPLGIIGGFILGLVLALCTSSYLYFLAHVVSSNRVHPRALWESWHPYLGSVITIMFFLFIVRQVLSLLMPPVPSGQALFMLINLILLIILNPIPEIIYQGRSEGLAMLQESVEFLRESGVEWFLPLVALAAFSFVFFPLPIFVTPLQIGNLSFPALGIGGTFWASPTSLIWAVVSAFLLFVLMVFRGVLFRALASGTRRQRVFRSRFS